MRQICPKCMGNKWIMLREGMVVPGPKGNLVSCDFCNHKGYIETEEKEET